LYGADGKKLGIYTVSSVTNTAIQFTQQSTNVYFAGRLLGVSVDRLGSVRYGGASGVGYQAQYPYGVEYTPTVNDREKYATYTRDSLTGLDYAMNRYYTSLWGRFLSVDPSWASVSPKNPQSWNRYGYAANDSVNHADPSGLFLDAEDCIVDPLACEAEDWGSGGGDGWGGGGDGCPDQSVMNNFDPTPVPPGPNPCPAQPQFTPPSCSISVIEGGPGTQPDLPAHTVVDTKISGVCVWGVCLAPVQTNYEAFPFPKTAAQNPNNWPEYFGGDWLNAQETFGFYPSGLTVWSESGTQICYDLAAVAAAYASWKPDTTTYYLYPQNSNSFTFWLLLKADVSVSILANEFLADTAPGWGWIPWGQ
jgi:RHS repeat-associated protein